MRGSRALSASVTRVQRVSSSAASAPSAAAACAPSPITVSVMSASSAVDVRPDSRAQPRPLMTVMMPDVLMHYQLNVNEITILYMLAWFLALSLLLCTYSDY